MKTIETKNISISRAAANQVQRQLINNTYSYESEQDVYNSGQMVMPVSDITTKGEPVNYVDRGEGEQVRISLHGTTEANFDGGTGSTENIRTTSATECDGCADDQCLNVSGTLVLVFNANPVVTLPSRSEYDHLRPCQIERVEQWIQNVLVPHEQEHVDAFNTYDGTVREPFQMKLCRSEWSPDVLQPTHDRIEVVRRLSAKALSDALDPFHTNIDLDCEDEEQQVEGTEAIPQ